MGRPRQFDRDEALERAMEVFWAKGYEAASLHDLTGAMGLSKSSLYETFGSKHELFLAAIGRYREAVVDPLAARLESDRPARVVLAEVFGEVIERAVRLRDSRGCFLGNCAVETAPGDPAVAAKVRAGLERIEDGFHGLLRRGQEAGDIPAGADARALARFLTGALNGLLVMAKAGHERERLEDVVRVSLSVLG